MYIELKEIDKDTLKVGDTVGVAREVSAGWKSSFRHDLIIPAKIVRITPKRTKISTDKFGDHDRREIFYEYNSDAIEENRLAVQFRNFRRNIYNLEEFKRKCKLEEISDEDLPEVAEHMKAITEILEKYKEK